MSAQPINLRCHPNHPGEGVASVAVSIRREAGGVALVYDLRGQPDELAIPEGNGSIRRDELWKHTCFELFLKDDSAETYTELNFSPNGDWAAYRFVRYRQERTDLDCVPPQVTTSVDSNGLVVSVFMPLDGLDVGTGQVRLGPAAIVAAKNGARSYWALYHPEDKPDFHLTENFKIILD